MLRLKYHHRRFASAALAMLIIGVIASAEELRVGVSTTLSGPAADLGINMNAGVLAALEEANRNGGVKGRTIKQTALDDGYEPTRTIPNMRQLAEQEKVLALVGNVGTPTAVVAIPIAMETHTPFFGAFTGAGVLRKNPPDRYVFNFRASYAEEVLSMVDWLINVEHLKSTEIAFFTQRDAYGDAGYGSGITALKRHGLTNEASIQHVRYDRNTVAVEDALANLMLLDPQPKAVIMVGAYKPCAKFIKLAKENSFKPYFLNVSFVGSESLLKELGSSGDGVIITQVVPNLNADLPIIRDYHKALKASNSKAIPSYGSLEGYAATRVFLKALESVEGDVSKEKLVDIFETMTEIDIGMGTKLGFSHTQHQACHTIWPTVIKDGQIVPLDWNVPENSGNGGRP